jgi:hypothetical protein
MADDKNWWVSWYNTHTGDAFELHSPWWVSGTRMSDDADTIVAAIRAPSEKAAKGKVIAAYDRPPVTSLEWRFCEERPEDWSPFGSDRFPQAAWMQWP